MWFIARATTILHSDEDYISVISKGLICSVGLLFIMLLVLIAAIALLGWRMNNAFGVVMIVAYVIFCVFTVLLELDHVKCPIRFAKCSMYR